MPRKLEKRVLDDGSVRWRVSVATGEIDPDGRRVFVRRTFKLEREAKAFIRRLEVSRDDGLLVRPSRMLTADWLEHWLSAIARHKVRPNTWQGYRTSASCCLIPTIGQLPLANLKPDLIRERVFEPMRERGLSTRTQALAYSVLHSALDAAVVDKKLSRNPAKGAKPGRQAGAGVETVEIAPLTTEGARALLEAAASDRLFAYYVTALGTGARPSELFGLTWQSVDLDGDPPSIRIEQSLVRDRVGWSLHPPKTRAGRRAIPIAPEVVRALRDHRVRQLEERLRLGKRWQDHGGFVFTMPTGEPVEIHNMRRRSWLPLLRAAKLGTWITLPSEGLIDRGGRHKFIPAHRLYDLRHTHATALIAAGCPVKVVSERLGHTSAAFTMDIYVHVLPAMASDAAEKAAAALLR